MELENAVYFITMDSSLEDVHLQAEGLVCGLTTEQLKDLAEYLKVDIVAITSKGRRVLAKKLRDHVDEIVEEYESGEDKLEFLKGLIDYLSGTEQEEGSSVQVSNTEETVTDGYEKAKEEYLNMQKKFQEMVEDQKKLLDEAQKKMESQKQGCSKVTQPTSNNETVSINLNSIPDNNVNTVLRRDFKICGTIGGEAKDKLSFVGVIRQIGSGLKKGYDEREIIDAVIRAVSSSSKLKMYLEMLCDITLPKLRQIIRAHYQNRRQNCTKS